MNKIALLAAAALLASVPAPAAAYTNYAQGFWTHGLWAGLAGCKNKIPERNRWYSVLVC